MVASPLAVPSQCGCKRTTAHLHYSSNHDFFVGLGLLCLALSGSLSFIAGYVKASTFLYPTIEERTAYETVTRYVGYALAPYERLFNAAVALELLTFVLATLAAATLHSIRFKSWHILGTIGAAPFWIASRLMYGYYLVTTEAALRSVPNEVCSSELLKAHCTEILSAAARVQQQFDAAYGFWISPQYQLVSLFLTLVASVFLVGATFTTKTVTTWEPTKRLSAAALQPLLSPVSEATPQRTSLVPEAGPIKFCRFCGAKIPRDSSFCEECGAKLT